MKKILLTLALILPGFPVFSHAGYVIDGSVPGNNLGIGTANPGQALDVQGTIRGLNFSGAGTGLTGTAASLNVGGSAGSVTAAAQPAITSLGTLTSLLVSGNVGLNSVTPGQQLDVQGTVRSKYFVGDGSALTGISGSVSGQTTNYVPVASNSTTFVPSTLIQVGGNVGLGSANPGEQLDVNGSLRAGFLYGDGSNLTNIGGSISGLTTGKFTKAASSTTIANSAVMTEVSGNVGIGSATPGQIFDVQGTIRGTQIIAGTGSVTLTGLGGNMGIGSTSPGGTLDLGTGTLCLSHTCSSTFLSSQWTTSGSDVYFSGGNVGIGGAPGAALSIPSGNVGIGTSIAADALTVIGQLSLTGASNSASVNITPVTDANNVMNLNASAIGASNGNTVLYIQGGAAGTHSFATGVTGDAFNRFTYNANGAEQWSPGNAGSDVYLYRTAANILQIDADGAGGTSGKLRIPGLKSSSGTRYVCVDTNGTLTSSASACSGT